jgi:hypothetical protein
MQDEPFSKICFLFRFIEDTRCWTTWQPHFTIYTNGEDHTRRLRKRLSIVAYREWNGACGAKRACELAEIHEFDNATFEA